MIRDFLAYVIVYGGVITFIFLMLVCAGKNSYDMTHPNGPSRRRLLPNVGRAGGHINWKHGQELSERTLREVMDDKPGKTVYWDARKQECVENREDLS